MVFMMGLVLVKADFLFCYVIIPEIYVPKARCRKHGKGLGVCTYHILLSALSGSSLC